MHAGELALPIRTAAERQPSYEEVVAANQQRVLRTAYRLLGRLEDAQDASQEVFLRLLRNFDHVEGDAAAWLYRVTVNVCNDQHRRRLTLVETRERADPAPGAERVLELKERQALLMAGLATLAERERAAVVLRDIEGLSTRDVAQILGVEEVTVRSQICGARMKLAKFVRGSR